MTVYDNIDYGLKICHIPKKELDEKVKWAAYILKIGEYLDK